MITVLHPPFLTFEKKTYKNLNKVETHLPSQSDEKLLPTSHYKRGKNKERIGKGVWREALEASENAEKVG